MSTPHTKAPWSVSFNGPDDTLIFGGGDLVRSEKCVAKVKTYHRSVLEAEANARLIAAAPELLAMLERLVPAMPDLGDIDLGEDDNALLDEARALIAKVKGIK